MVMITTIATIVIECVWFVSERDMEVSIKQIYQAYKKCHSGKTKTPQAKNQLNKAQLSKIPLHKQLKNVPANKGLPIGNLSSQFFGNVYMNELDQFVKHTLKVKSYVRFVDDFILLGEKQECQKWQQQIEFFLATKLQLKLKKEKFLKPINSGVDFLGYIIYPHYKLVRKRVVHNFYQKLKTWYQDNVISPKNGRLFCLNSKNNTYLNSLFASYLGHFKHARYYKILQSKKQQFWWLNLFFYQKNNQYYSTTYCQFASKFSHQVSFFNHFFQGFVVLIQKGKNFIINNDNNQMPLKYLSTYLQKLHYQQQSYIFVSEQGYVHNRLKQRRVRQLFISNQSSFI
jgi:hypothetical protein